LVNAVYAGVGLDVPAKADVTLVGDYHPSKYGSDGYVRGVKPADLESGGGRRGSQSHKQETETTNGHELTRINTEFQKKAEEGTRQEDLRQENGDLKTGGRT